METRDYYDAFNYLTKQRAAAAESLHVLRNVTDPAWQGTIAAHEADRVAADELLDELLAELLGH